MEIIKQMTLGLLIIKVCSNFFCEFLSYRISEKKYDTGVVLINRIRIFNLMAESEYDVIVIGGGIIGSSIAYHLVKANQRVVLIDADHKGKATKAGAGIISAPTTFVENEDMYSFLLNASRYYPEISKELEIQNGVKTSYEVSEEVVVANADDQITQFNEAVKRMLSRQQRYNFPPTSELYEMEINEFSQRFPDLKIPKKALYYSSAGKIDGKEFTNAIKKVGMALGLKILNGTVETLQFDEHNCTGVNLDNQSITATNTIIAGGAWSKSFETQLNIKLQIYPQRGQIVHLVLKESQKEIPIIISMSDYYSLNWGPDHIIVGATREDDSGFIAKNTVKGIQSVLRQGLEMIPALIDGEISEIRVGLRPYSKDKLPIMGKIPDKAGIWVATGHGPLGLTSAPYTGKLMADAIVESKFDPIFEKFSPERFKR